MGSWMVVRRTKGALCRNIRLYNNQFTLCIMCVVQYAVVAAGMCGFVLSASGLLYLCAQRIYRQTQSKHYSYTGTLAARRVLVAGSNGNGFGMVVKRRHIQVNCNYLTHPKCTYFSSQPIIISSCFSNNNNREILWLMYVRYPNPTPIHPPSPATMPRTCFTAPLPDALL